MQAQNAGSRPFVSSTAPASFPTVYIVDEDPALHASITTLIRTEGWLVESFPSIEDFLARARALTPSCLLLDISAPQLDGLALQEIIAERAETPVIFVTSRHDARMTLRAMKVGAVDLLTKPLSGPAVASAIRSALERSRRALAQEAVMRVLQTRYASLSRRERQVLRLVVTGLLNKQIAGELGITEVTVKVHRGRVMRKMLARSLAELVNMAARLGPGAAVNPAASAWRWLPLQDGAQAAH